MVKGAGEGEGRKEDSPVREKQGDEGGVGGGVEDE